MPCAQSISEVRCLTRRSSPLKQGEALANALGLASATDIDPAIFREHGFRSPHFRRISKSKKAIFEAWKTALSKAVREIHRASKVVSLPTSSIRGIRLPNRPPGDEHGESPFDILRTASPALSDLATSVLHAEMVATFGSLPSRRVLPEMGLIVHQLGPTQDRTAATFAQNSGFPLFFSI